MIARKRKSIADRHEALQKEFNELLKEEESLKKKKSRLGLTPKRIKNPDDSKQRTPKAASRTVDAGAEKNDRVPEDGNSEALPMQNTVSLNRDTDEQLHRKIDRLSEQLRNANKIKHLF